MSIMFNYYSVSFNFFNYKFGIVNSMNVIIGNKRNISNSFSDFVKCFMVICVSIYLFMCLIVYSKCRYISRFGSECIFYSIR